MSMEPTPENQDLFLARRGDKEALDRILARLQGELRSMAHRRLGPGLRAKLHTSDLLQSAFGDVIHGIEDFRGQSEDDFINWFGGILNHTIQDRARYFRAEKRKDQEAITTSGLRDKRESPEQTFFRRDREKHLAQSMEEALSELTPDQREIMELKFSRGLSYQEIASSMGRSPEAVRRQVWRARSSLAAKLEKQGR